MLFTQGKTEIAPSEAGYDESRLEVLNRHLQGIIDAGDIQCAMYCVSRHGKVFAHGSLGKKSYRAEDNSPALPDSVRYFASMSKTFVATAIMKMVEDGHTRLNVPVGEILPQFNTPPFNEINLLHLLTHSSGLHADPGCLPNKYQSNYWKLISDAIDKHDFEKDGEFDWISASLAVIGSGMRKRPGEEWAYCSYGYTILSAVVEKLTGMRYQEYVTENILKPIGMNDTCFDLTPELAKRAIVSNERMEQELNDIINGKSETDKWELAKIPEAGMNGTAYDLVRFGNMFLSNGISNGNRVLGRKGVEKISAKQIHDLPNYSWGAGGVGRSYCAGFDLRTDQPFICSDNTFSHEGAGYASIYIDPTEDMVAAWFVPFTEHDRWIVKSLYNVVNVIWSGLK
ncbi:MAG: beta-lactamase family protein [Clostridiales bacterium]|nr:beta-lactamase family protein [Clostridiales bacterium]